MQSYKPTENIERAKRDLSRHAKLRKELELLKTRYDLEFETAASPAPSWPSVAVVPDIKRTKPFHNEYFTPKYARERDANYYAIEPRSPSDPERLAFRITACVDNREQIKVEAARILEEMAVIEARIRAWCTHDQAMVLIRSFCLGQSWTEIGEALSASRSTVYRFYVAGLEAYGEKLKPIDTE